jgi:hypothetical protein
VASGVMNGPGQFQVVAGLSDTNASLPVGRQNSMSGSWDGLWSVHLKEIQGTPEPYGSSLRGTCTANPLCEAAAALAPTDCDPKEASC